MCLDWASNDVTHGNKAIELIQVCFHKIYILMWMTIYFRNTCTYRNNFRDFSKCIHYEGLKETYILILSHQYFRPASRLYHHKNKVPQKNTAQSFSAPRIPKYSRKKSLNFQKCLEVVPPDLFFWSSEKITSVWSSDLKLCISCDIAYANLTKVLTVRPWGYPWWGWLGRWPPNTWTLSV